jgi:hypothetical protein
MEEHLIDLIRIMIDMLYLCIERIVGLTDGCRILEKKNCKLATMTLVHSTKEVGGHLK